MFVINNKKIFIFISITLVALSVILLSVFGLKLGIDFKGGTLTEISYPEMKPTPAELADAIKALGIGESIIQPTGANGYIVKTKDLTEPERISLFQSFSAGGKYKVEEKSFTSIGPSIGKELRQKAVFAIMAVLLAIILFVAYAFRKVSKPVSSWKYGLIAVVTLLHDVAIPIGLFALLGHFAGAEVDTLFVVAILAVLGLSVADTIVVFDRIRENLKNKTFPEFRETVGRSLGQVYTRSINTSLTTILVLLALFFFGPVATKYFSLMLIAGMFFGAYSSIFLASPLLVLAEEWQLKKKGKKEFENDI